jgi:hypothetical protein
VCVGGPSTERDLVVFKFGFMSESVLVFGKGFTARFASLPESEDRCKEPLNRPEMGRFCGCDPPDREPLLEHETSGSEACTLILVLLLLD